MSGDPTDERTIPVVDEQDIPLGVVDMDVIEGHAYWCAHQLATATDDAEVTQILDDWTRQYEDDRVFAGFLAVTVRYLSKEVVRPLIDACAPLMPTLKADLARARDNVAEALGGDAS